MSVTVYRWPPVAPKRWEWTLDDPVEESVSILTGAAYLSAAQRRRKLGTLEVSGRRDGMGAGYMESLKELLRGGLNAVRLSSYPVNPHFDATRQRDLRQSGELGWQEGSDGLDWTASGAALLWYTGAYLRGSTGTDAAGFPVITVSGLPVSTLVARPSEFLTVFADEADLVGTTVRILTAARSDGSGVAVVRLHEDPGVFADCRVNLGTRQSAVFRPVQIPRAAQPAQGDWSYTWEFREIFEDEVGAGGFVEVDPW